MVQSYIKAISSRGAVINTIVAKSTAQALMERYPDIVGEIDFTSWAKSMFKRMGFVKRMKTSSKVDIPDGARRSNIFFYMI